MPLAQTLTSGKTEEEYVAILQHLRMSVPGFNPQLVMTDFEPALQNAWRRVFQCNVAGCYWHYCRVCTLHLCLKNTPAVHRCESDSMSFVAGHFEESKGIGVSAINQQQCACKEDCEILLRPGSPTSSSHQKRPRHAYGRCSP